MMKYRVKFSNDKMNFDEEFEGENAQDIVKAMQALAASKMGKLAGIFVLSLPPELFAREVIKKYNAEIQKTLELPDNCEDFLATGTKEGILIPLTAEQA
jgi:hypothetical protein